MQSALIAKRVRDLAGEKNIPVYAFVEDVAASGGYWLACAADEIYANASSIVGSIGVISASFGLHEAIHKLGVERRVYTAGEKKMMLDPFQPENPDDVERLQALQQEIHRNFQDWVRERRGVRLRGLDSDLFSGEFWSGTRAARARPRRRHRRPAQPHAAPLRRHGAGCGWSARRRPGSGAGSGRIPTAWLPRGLLPESWADDVVSAVEARSLWSRFGL